VKRHALAWKGPAIYTATMPAARFSTLLILGASSALWWRAAKRGDL
jgi:hypothetical protein